MRFVQTHGEDEFKDVHICLLYMYAGEVSTFSITE